MITLKIKPLSVNQCWQGKRYKTPLYKKYEQDLTLLLPAVIKLPARIRIEIEVGFSSKQADVDNICKPFLDIMQKKYGFNDRDVYELSLVKKIVPKGGEYISFIVSGTGVE